MIGSTSCVRSEPVTVALVSQLKRHDMNVSTHVSSSLPFYLARSIWRTHYLLRAASHPLLTFGLLGMSFEAIIIMVKPFCAVFCLTPVDPFLLQSGMSHIFGGERWALATAASTSICSDFL